MIFPATIPATIVTNTQLKLPNRNWSKKRPKSVTQTSEVSRLTANTIPIRIPIIFQFGFWRAYNVQLTERSLPTALICVATVPAPDWITWNNRRVMPLENSNGARRVNGMGRDCISAINASSTAFSLPAAPGYTSVQLSIFTPKFFSVGLAGGGGGGGGATGARAAATRGPAQPETPGALSAREVERSPSDKSAAASRAAATRGPRAVFLSISKMVSQPFPSGHRVALLDLLFPLASMLELEMVRDGTNVRKGVVP